MAACDDSPAVQLFHINARNGRRARPELWGDADELRPGLAADALRRLADVVDGQTCRVDVGMAAGGELRIGIVPCDAGAMVPAGAIAAALLGLSGGSQHDRNRRMG
ncbi:MAG: hypothetical protein PHS60_15200 [Zavarzinia sp.]|nr:hypothetical protein [Zavarzinia sp.]